MKYLSISVLFLLPFPLLAVDEASKKEIIQRCKSQMSEYGAAMVKSCVDQDFAAWKKVSAYKESHQEISIRCLDQMREYGFAMTESCLSLIHI